MKEVQAVVVVAVYALLASLDIFAASPTELAVRGPVDDLSAFINVLSACTSPSGDALEAFGILAKRSSTILALSGPVGAVAAFAIHTVFTKPSDNATLVAYQNRTLVEFTRLGQMVNQTRREVKFDSMFSQYVLTVVDGTELLEMDIVEVVLNATIVDRRLLGRDFVERCRGIGRTYFFMRTRLVTQCRIPTGRELRLMIEVQSLLSKYEVRYDDEQPQIFHMRMHLALFVSSLDSEESGEVFEKLQDELSRHNYLTVESLEHVMEAVGAYNKDINECMLTATLAAYSSQRLPLFQMIDIIRDDIGRLLEVNAYCLNVTYEGHRESMEFTSNRIGRAVSEIVDTGPAVLYVSRGKLSAEAGLPKSNFFVTRHLRSTAATRVAAAFEFKLDYKSNITDILRDKYNWQLDDLRYEIEDQLRVRLTDPSRFNTAIFVRDTEFWDGCRVLYQNYWVKAGFPPLTCATSMSKLVPGTWCYENAIFLML